MTVKLLRNSFRIFLFLFSSLYVWGEEVVSSQSGESSIDFNKLLHEHIGNFSVRELVYCFGIILLTLILRKLLVGFLFKNLEFLARKTEIEYDDKMLEALKTPCLNFVLVLGIYLAFQVLSMDSDWSKFVSLLFKGSSMLLVFWGALRMSDVFFDVITDVGHKRGSSIAGFMPLIKKAMRVFLVLIGVTVVMDNLGYSIGGILAGLGIGGAAFAFAAKDTIANIYGSVALAADRPFKVGDWIQIGDKVDGDVESIGLRSTKVRTWPKTVLSIPNAVLANEMINNWSRMPKRRVKQVVGVTYETSPEDMEGLVQDIRKLLKEDEGVNQDFILVNFTDFGQSSLDILVYYFTNTTQWLNHMDVRQRINIKIMKAVKARGSSIAFPTRSVYLEGDMANKMMGDGMLPGDFGSDKPV
jgi:MscS family membrane protein